MVGCRCVAQHVVCCAIRSRRRVLPGSWEVVIDLFLVDCPVSVTKVRQGSLNEAIRQGIRDTDIGGEKCVSEDRAFPLKVNYPLYIWERLHRFPLAHSLDPLKGHARNCRAKHLLPVGPFLVSDVFLPVGPCFGFFFPEFLLTYVELGMSSAFTYLVLLD